MNETEQQIYHIVIVLCPSESRTLENKYAFYEIENDKREREKLIYIGGQIRMQAAVDLASQIKEAYVVVGGSRPKVDDMKGYLEQELGNKTPPIIRIVSKSDTTGNLMAIYKCRRKYKNFFSKKKKVGILTNFYHLPRAMRFVASRFTDINFIPIAAEAVISRYHPTYALYTQEFLLRIAKEIDGLRDFENGSYKKQKEFVNNPEWEEWKCFIPDTDLKILRNLSYKTSI